MSSGPAGDAEVPAFWRALGLPGLADLHIHFLPPRLMHRVWGHVDEGAPVVGSRGPIVYRWSDEERVEHLKTLGVRAYPAMAWADREGVAADLNAWTMDFARRTPGCVPGATLYPEPGVNRYTRTALDAGAKVFRVHFQAGGFPATHSLLDAVWGVLAEAGTPVVMHIGSGAVPAGHTGVEQLAAVLRRHPRLVVVLARLGAPEYARALDLADGYERVHLDTSLAFTRFFEQFAPYPRALLPRLRDLGLAGRVVFGSDFPNLPHAYAHQLDALARLDLGDAWLKAVCWHNAAALLTLR